MFAKAFEIIAPSIFPIIWTRDEGGGNTTVGCAGTGCFVSNDGKGITAYHVVSEPDDGRKYWLPPEGNGMTEEITWLSDAPDRDLASFQVHRKSTKPVTFASKAPVPGTSVCAIGFPLSQMRLGDRGLDLTFVRPYLIQSMVMDTFLLKYPTGEPYPAVFTTDPFLPGMSGGPVVNMEGEVVGMARGISGRISSRGNVHNGVSIPNDMLIEFLNGNQSER